LCGTGRRRGTEIAEWCTNKSHFAILSNGVIAMSDNRGQQNTHDTGSPTSRGRDDLRTASQKDKPKDQRAEGRDKKDAKDKSDGAKSK